MRENADIKIVGKHVILIPYEATHVEKYHGWMSDPELQQLTASEPLTLEQEYEMQETWRHDEDSARPKSIARTIVLQALIGDTNLFLNQDYVLANSDDDGDANKDRDTNNEDRIVAEAEIMIAEPAARGKGYGKEAISLMLKYGHADLNIQEYVSKISYQNKASQNLFRKLQFEEQSRSEAFQEITFKRTVDTSWTKWLDEEISEYGIHFYEKNG